jgi:hypothetical protein
LAIGRLGAMKFRFSVVRPFKAVRPISGTERQFEPGEFVVRDTGQHGETIALEFEGSLFTVERSVFDECCRLKLETGPG